MLLALDIGNTNIKSALFDGNTLFEFIIHSKVLDVIRYAKDKKINAALKALFGEATFQQTRIPFYANAVDLESGEAVILDSGRLWEAARASSAIPFLFTPVFHQDRYLIDGGLLNNVPVDIVREKGEVDILIGVELGGMATRQYIAGIVWEKYYRKPKTFELYPSLISRLKMNTSLMAHIMLRSLDILREAVEEEKYKKAKPDFIIRPQVDCISILDFKSYNKAFARGVEAAEKIVPDIKKLIAEKEQEKAGGSQQAIESMGRK